MSRVCSRQRSRNPEHETHKRTSSAPREVLCSRTPKNLSTCEDQRPRQPFPHARTSLNIRAWEVGARGESGSGEHESEDGGTRGMLGSGSRPLAPSRSALFLFPIRGRGRRSLVVFAPFRHPRILHPKADPNRLQLKHGTRQPIETMVRLCHPILKP